MNILKYKILGNQLISNVYYINDLHTRSLLEKNDEFLRELKTFDTLNNNSTSPITQQDRLNIFDEFLNEHLTSNISNYDIYNPQDRYILIEKLFQQANPNINIKQKLYFQNKINDYLTINGNNSFFHIESLLYDTIVNDSYSDKYSEKLARLSGIYFDEKYDSKPLPRGKEKEIYNQKFKKIATLLSNEMNISQENNNQPQIVLTFDKKSSMDKLKNNRITSTEKIKLNNHKM